MQAYIIIIILATYSIIMSIDALLKASKMRTLKYELYQVTMQTCRQIERQAYSNINEIKTLREEFDETTQLAIAQRDAARTEIDHLTKEINRLYGDNRRNQSTAENLKKKLKELETPPEPLTISEPYPMPRSDPHPRNNRMTDFTGVRKKERI